MAAEKPPRSSGAADYYGSSHRLWQRTKRSGAPRWVWWSIIVVSFIGIGAAVALYLAAHSFLVAGVFVGIAFFVDVAVLNFADLGRAADRDQRPPND